MVTRYFFMKITNSIASLFYHSIQEKQTSSADVQRSEVLIYFLTGTPTQNIYARKHKSLAREKKRINWYHSAWKYIKNGAYAPKTKQMCCCNDGTIHFPKELFRYDFAMLLLLPV